VICLLLPLLAAAAGRALYLPRREIGQQLFCFRPFFKKFNLFLFSFERKLK
jgi:hypothetical protein